LIPTIVPVITFTGVNQESIMSRFYPITQEEMEAFLFPKGFVRMQLPRTIENVYGKRVTKDGFPVSIRVYSSIDGGEARKNGEDAIRVMPYTLFGEQPVLVGKIQKVLRITTWEKNLAKAIDNWDAQWKLCSACGYPMTLRSSGKFWGCCTYSVTKCDGKTPKNLNHMLIDISNATVN